MACGDWRVRNDHDKWRLAGVDWQEASYMTIVATTRHGCEQLKIADIQGTGDGVKHVPPAIGLYLYMYMNKYM